MIDYQEIKDMIIPGISEETQKLNHLLEKLAQKDISILIDGETGTGKTTIAKRIHEKSLRKEHPFVKIATFNEATFISDLFGHKKGAFTGALETKVGLVKLADNGTLFFDEIGDLGYEMQLQLLEFLDSGQYRIMGGTRVFNSELRTIFATNRDLASAVENKQFREDLFYRINVVQITIPSLRDREEDLEIWIELFFEKHAKLLSNKELLPKLKSTFQSEYSDYSWPGNIRELENKVQKTLATEMVCPPPKTEQKWKKVEGAITDPINGKAMSIYTPEQ